MTKAVESILILKWTLTHHVTLLMWSHQHVTSKSKERIHLSMRETNPVILEAVSQSLQDGVRSDECPARREVLG